MSNELDRIRQTIPEIVALRRAHATVRKSIVLKAGDDIPDEGTVTRELYDAVTRGESIPDDLGTRLLASRRALEEHQARNDALHAVRERIEAELKATDVDHANDFLTALAAQLTEVLDEAGQLATALGDNRTAEQVIKAGPEAVVAWNRLDTLANTYRDIREAQRQATRNGWSSHASTEVFTTRWWGLRMVITDPTALWTPSNTTPPPWPHTASRPEQWTNPPADNLEFLLWAAANREYVWLPTVPQLLDAAEEQTQRDERKKLKKRDPRAAAEEREAAGHAVDLLQMESSHGVPAGFGLRTSDLTA